jgi:cyclophilin family peptidyl-prolyl cis-trans isomerase/HEAT repeat protein
MTRRLFAALRPCAIWLAVAAASACASAPPAPPPPPPGPTFEQKIGSILRLEDRRVLRDPAAAPAAPIAPPAPAATRGRQAVVVAPPPPPPPDLVRMLTDGEARIRRRAALAIGRVGLAEGVAPLVGLLADSDPEVRQMAAFALGLLRDKSAREPLVRALDDASPLVQGSAAEALGQIGDPATAEAVGRFVGQIVASGAFAQPPGDDDDARRDTPTAACRLGLFALVRLKAYPALAAAVLDAGGQPRVRWWPVAYALQRIEDARALPALLTLARDQHPVTRAFAVKGLATLKDPSALPVLMPLVSSGDRAVLIETVRALGGIGDPSAGQALLRIIHDAAADPHVRLEAVGAIGNLRAPGVAEALLDVLSDPSAPVRAAALRSLAVADPDNFMTVLSGLDPDPHWSVRAALATLLGTMTLEAGRPRLTSMLVDSDQRVIPFVLAALVKLKAPDAAAILLERLKADDPIVRAAAAAGIGELKPPGGTQALTEAYRFGERDATYAARGAALTALEKYGAAVALPVLTTALADKDWAVRVRAAALIRQLDPNRAGGDIDASIRPAPTTVAPDTYVSPRLVDPTVSTQAYLDTDRGTIQIELAVLDAPLTVENFISLARKGFFNGLSVHRVVPNFVMQDGDPRGDGEGTPGYTIRDELNERPYLRGAVGMALDWADTGGSQYFIAHSPQPHLDARYTVFGRVIAGMDVVDKIQPWDVIRSVRIWDGTAMTSR